MDSEWRRLVSVASQRLAVKGLRAFPALAFGTDSRCAVSGLRIFSLKYQNSGIDLVLPSNYQTDMSTDDSKLSEPVKRLAKLYVTGFPRSMPEEKVKPLLEQLFKQVGEVVSVQIIGSFGFVTMSTGEEARQAVERLQGSEFEGGTLTVNEALSMIRIYLTKPDDSEGYLWVEGFLAIVISGDSKIAFADHLKYQGGGAVGEYHAVLRSTTGEEGERGWTVSVNEWLCLNSLSESPDLQEFEDKRYGRMLSDLQGLYIMMGDWIEWKDGKEREGYWVDPNLLKSWETTDGFRIEKDDGGIWVSFDSLDESVPAIDVESISEAVPGNMCFYS